MVKLFYTQMSPPSRAVLLLARAINLSLDLNNVDVMAGENFTEEFLNMNPAHTIPTIDDGGFYLAESGAINVYLAEKYAADDSLYPNDSQKRATINHRLLLSAGTLWPRIMQTYLHPVLVQKIGINDLILDKVDDAFSSLNSFLQGHDWVAGDDISVADYTLVTIATCAEALGHDVGKFENVSAWITRCKETMPDYDDLAQPGMDQLADIFHSKLAEIQSIDN